MQLYFLQCVGSTSHHTSYDSPSLTRRLALMPMSQSAFIPKHISYAQEGQKRNRGTVHPCCTVTTIPAEVTFQGQTHGHVMCGVGVLFLFAVNLFGKTFRINALSAPEQCSTIVLSMLRDTLLPPWWDNIWLLFRHTCRRESIHAKAIFSSLFCHSFNWPSPTLPGGSTNSSFVLQESS